MVAWLEGGLDRVERLRTLLTDWRFMRRSLGGVLPSRFAATGSKGVQSTSYRVLPQLFEGRVRDDDVLVDVGCGRGRVLSWWLRRGYRNRMIGLELDDEIAADTRRRLARYPQVSIVSGDAVEKLPDTGTLFFLFNPFDRATLVRFRDKLAGTARDSVRAVYYNALHIDVFGGDPGWEIMPIATRKCLDCAVVHPAFVASRRAQSPLR